jgi:transcriptional regulator with XRE-family HTH domain
MRGTGMEGHEDLDDADREVESFLERSAQAHFAAALLVRLRRERAKNRRRREQMTEERETAPWRHYLREWRVERGLTLHDLSVATGISKEMISRYETYKRGLSIDVQYRLIAALRIKPSQFFHAPKSFIAEWLEAGEKASTESPETREKMLAAIREIQSKI